MAPANPVHHFLAGGGEMGERMRALDWTKTPLGPVESWPQSLRSPVSMLLPSKAQIILFWGPEFVVLYNDAYRTVFGAKHPQMLGQPGRIAWSEIWDSVLHPLLDGVVRTGEAFHARDMLFFLSRYGFAEETYFDVSYDPVRDESGAVGGAFCIVTETSGRVVGERRLALLKDLAARNATARTPREACVLAMETLAGKPDVPFARAYLGDELQAGTPGAETQQVKELPIPGGRLVIGLNPQRPFDAQYAAFLDLVAGQLATAVTNAQAYEDERKRSDALAELDRAKTAFFSNVSHEFRTPLTLLLAPLEDALAGNLPPEERARLEVAQRNAQRLLKLVNTLLDFSRIEAGRTQGSFQPTDLAALTAELASHFRSACERAGMRLEVDCAALGEPAYVDPDMWEKIVFNLLSNAFKFTLEGSIRVALRREADRAVLEVSDTGTGIPAAELPHLFERFHRIEGAHGRSQEGSGIGLSFVRELARLHLGEVGVQSEPGRGTTFRVSLPLGRAHLAAERVGRASAAEPSQRGAAFVEEALSWLPSDTQPAAAPAPGQQKRSRILLADDNADMRGYVQRLLGADYEVVAVADGEAALAAARAQPFDLVLSDVMMPKLDGFGLIAALRGDERTRSLPVMLLSARAGEEARVEGVAAGADDYLVKPFSAKELQARVAARLEIAGIRRAAEAALRDEAQALAALNEQRVQLIGKLQESERRKDEFIATLSHELRNPLAPIRNAVMLLKGSANDPELTKKALAILDRQVNHTIRLVDDLLDVARVTRGTIALDRRNVRLAEVVESAVEISRPHLEHAGHRLEVELPREPIALHADPVRIAQVLANLLNNAAKFTAAGGDIRVAARRDGAQAVLSVRDSGRGIAAERLAGIFDAFGHWQGDLYRDGGGLGIGLSLAKKLVEMHGGTIEARSEGAGKGAEFVVRLPIDPLQPEPQPEAPAQPRDTRQRVLVVDDNVDSAQTLGMLLRRMGHDVELAHDGREALSAAARERPQVVILDLGLPDVDGYDVAGRMRQDIDLKDVRLIALTGFGRDRDRDRSREAGFDRHLVKPVDLDALRRALEN